MNLTLNDTKDFPVHNLFEIEDLQNHPYSNEQSIETIHRTSIALCLVIYHLGLMVFEWGASRRKHADHMLIKYPVSIIASAIGVVTTGFGIAYGEPHVMGSKYFLTAGMFDVDQETP